jgi:hypothetical protein
MTTAAFPLSWPPGRKRTPKHAVRRSSFSPGTRPVEVANVTAELRRLGARGVIVSTNIRLRNDGLPYANDRAPEDQGVAVYFDYSGGQKCFACDRWTTVAENLRAIFKSIEAIRGLERWGSKDFVEAAFTGFSALPPPAAGRPTRAWRVILGFAESAQPSRDEIEMAFRKALKTDHPDTPGGSHDAMVELNLAREQALQEIANA